MQPLRLLIILAAFAGSMVCPGATAQEPMSSGTLNVVPWPIRTVSSSPQIAEGVEFRRETLFLQWNSAVLLRRQIKSFSEPVNRRRW